MQTLLLGLIGLPPVNGVLPQAPMHTRSLAHLRRGEGAESGKRGGGQGEGAEEAGSRGGGQGEGAEAGGRGGGQLTAGRPAELCAINHEGCPEEPQQPQLQQQLQQPSLAGPEGAPDAAKGPLLEGASGLLLLGTVQLEVGGSILLVSACWGWCGWR